MKKRRAYLIGGISGVGKSAVLDEISQLTQRFEIIRGHKYFMQWLGLREGDYDTLRSLPYKFKNKELDKMMRKLVCDDSEALKYKKALLIDAHYLRINRGCITPATGSWISVFDGLFLLTADAETVFRRINVDFLKTNKDRKLFPPETNQQAKILLLDIYQRRIVEEVKKLSCHFHIPYFIIYNKEGILGQVAKELMHHIDTIKT